MSNALARAMAPLTRRLKLMFSRCVVLSTDDFGGTMTAKVKLFDGEIRDGVECLQPYGYSARPRKNAPGGLMASLAGNHDLGFVIVSDDRRYRPRGKEEGEVIFYTDEDEGDEDHRIYFKRGKVIEIIAGASKIVLSPTGITITTPSYDVNQV